MAHGKDHHPLRLWGFFLALTALTVGEVGLYEVWRHTAADGHPFVPKFAIVFIILVLTLPKAAIVMTFFMHLRFEKVLVVLLAVAPLALVLIAVLTIVADTKVLKGYAQNRMAKITGHGVDHDPAAAPAKSGPPTPVPVKPAPHEE